MATYSPSKITKDGNTYNFTDDTKIPLAGSNQISGSLIPATDNSIDIGSSTKNIKLVYAHKIVAADELCLVSANDDKTTMVSGGTDSTSARLILAGKDYSYLNRNGYFFLQANNGTSLSILQGTPSGTLTWNSKNIAMQEDVVPRSGGAVMTGNTLGRTVNTNEFRLDGGTTWNDGASLSLSGKNRTDSFSGAIVLHMSNGSQEKQMTLFPNGTWTWEGTACQITSDQRYKQQITEIDDKLLDAWEDVELSQFKYNDAVDQKKDKARLHTGYVVQQIDEACKSHGVDVSKYGLYCHEEYAEETREVEHDDGTKTTEVVRPTNEHYSLRYTEALIVECAYLRKCIKELRNEIEQLKSSK